LSSAAARSPTGLKSSPDHEWVGLSLLGKAIGEWDIASSQQAAKKGKTKCTVLLLSVG
jgi:hypothetical protein